jgi:hypothetical protein
MSGMTSGCALAKMLSQFGRVLVLVQTLFLSEYTAVPLDTTSTGVVANEPAGCSFHFVTWASHNEESLTHSCGARAGGRTSLLATVSTGSCSRTCTDRQLPSSSR